jgi:RHS repeat-associated protein
MLRSAGVPRPAASLAASEENVALGARARVPWRAAVVAALLAILLGATLARILMDGRSSSVAPVLGASARSHHEGLSDLPMVLQGQISGVLGAGSSAYRMQAVAGGFAGATPSQGLHLGFGRSGVLVHAGKTQVALSLRAIGYGTSLVPLAAASPQATANRVWYAHKGASEWYANGPLGLEQGFTVARTPSRRATAGPLTLSMGLSGNARASLTGHGQGLILSHAGGPSLRYRGLTATDARGHSLHSWLQLSGDRVLLRVEARGARYPLRIDPFITQAKLLGGTEEVGTEPRFGISVSLSSDGNTALIGADFDNPLLGASIGAAWVFTRSGSTWTQQGPKLTGTGEERNRYFGNQVAISGDGNTALISGPGESESAGAVWVFTRTEGKWTQQAVLTGGEEENFSEKQGGGFGSGVALSSEGSTALIGGANDHGAIGAAWVFTRTEGKWAQQGKKITGGEELGKGNFGRGVALSSDGNTALIGGPSDKEGIGAVWAFTRSEGKWTQQQKITSSTGFLAQIKPLVSEESGNGEFGDRVSLSSDGNTALVGGPGDKEGAGAAWVFTRMEGKWHQQGPKLTGHEEIGKAFFGGSVALAGNGDTALIGGSNDNFVAGPEAKGAAWVFTRSGTTWSEVRPKLVRGASSEYGPEFGTGVALSSEGNTALVGAPFYETFKGKEEVTLGGAAWVLTYSSSNPSPEEVYGLENEAAPNRPSCFLGHPVNCTTGNQVETQTDLAVGGRGPGLHLTRTYNSQLAANQTKPGPFGYGWTGPYSAHLEVNEVAETATVHQDNGSTVSFELTSGTTYAPVSSLVQATLVKEGTNYVYTLPNQTKLQFNSSGQLTSETDRNGNAITLTHNAEGRLESVADADGRKLTFAYNAQGQVESVKDPMGHTVKYTYESGNLATVTQPGESALRWQYKYNGEHEMTSETDGRGHAVTSEYDSSHRVISQTDAMERTRKWEYIGTIGREYTVTRITEPNDAVTQEEFNLNGLPVSVTHAYGTSLAATTAYEYDASGDLLASTDPNNHTTKYGYDAAGDRTSATDANGDETQSTYNSAHELLTTTTPKGEKTTIKRDSHGNPEVIERAAPGSKTQKTTYKYDSQGDLTSETRPLERTWTYEYDSYGDHESETDPEGNKRTWKYNEDSQEIAAVSPRGNVKGAEPSKYETRIERNAAGLPILVTDPLGHTTKYAYDGNGNLETLADANSHKTTYTYNADNQTTAIKEPNGTVTETEYDKDGEIISQTDGNKHTTKYERNLLGQVTEAIDPLGRKTLKEYDAAGNLKKLTDPEKRITSYAYDPGNRLTEVTFSDGKTHSVKYEYDKDGDHTKMIDGTGTTKYTYDTLDRLTESENGHKEKLKYEYDLANEPTKITYPNGKAVTRAYDKDGRLEKVTDWSSNATKFSYDPDSDLVATTFPTATGTEDKYAYNEADQMTETTMTKGAETLASLAYTRDNDGQLKKTISKGLPGAETAEYEYDENNRLTKAGSTPYEYDAADNPTKIASSTYSYDKSDEIEKSTEATFTYDELGERAKSTPTGAATTYGYNQAGDLISLERPKEGEKTEIKDTYAYDGDGLRTSQVIAGKTSYLAWDLAEQTPLLLNDGTNSYIYGPSGTTIEQINNTTGTVQYLHHDQAGSTRLLTGSTGKTEATFTYGPYGELTGSTGTATTPLGYDGQYTSSDTGLIYLRHRVYDPKTAQFLTVDPLVVVTHEPYVYAGDNPINYRDRSGLGIEEIFEGGSGIPCPWCSAAEGVAEALEGAYHEAQHGVEWLNNQIGTEELGEPVEQGAGAAEKGCELLEKDKTGRVHGDIPNYPNPEWTEEDLEQVAEDLRDSIEQRRQNLNDEGEEPGHRNKLGEQERLLKQIEKRLSGS